MEDCILPHGPNQKVSNIHCIENQKMSFNCRFFGASGYYHEACYQDGEFSSFLFMRHLLLSFNEDYRLDYWEEDNNLDLNWVFFRELKTIIVKLLSINPGSRMKLKDAALKLYELKMNFVGFQDLHMEYAFPLTNASLRAFLHDQTTETRKETSTEKTYGRMKRIDTKRIFQTSEKEDEFNLIQRDTQLCVPISAMKLLIFALVEFIEQNLRGLTDLGKLTETILKDRHFFQQLLTLCCFVVSPRSVNGLNHGYFDDGFQSATQKQNIRE